MIKDLHKYKTDLFMKMIESGELPLRPGVKRLIVEASVAGAAHSHISFDDPDTRSLGFAFDTTMTAFGSTNFHPSPHTPSLAGVPVAVCSTSNERSVSAVVQMLGADLADKIRIFAGDVVPKKKPDPAIYNLAAQELGVDPAKSALFWLLLLLVEESQGTKFRSLAAGVSSSRTRG